MQGTVLLCVCESLCVSVSEMFLYTVSVCLSARPPTPGPLDVSLAVGDGSAAAQLDDHLLAVMEGPLVSQLLQGAGCICQHAHPLARSREEGGGKVAARQHHGLCLLPLAWPCLALLCTKKKTPPRMLSLCYLFLTSSATVNHTSVVSCLITDVILSNEQLGEIDKEAD